jgi:predicted nucleic acid-binding protein
LLSRRERARAIGAIRRSSQFFRIEPGPEVARDPDDDVFLHLAVAADAVAVVTGGRDLLVLGDFAGIPILSPTRFLRCERSIRRGRRERGE